MAKLNKNFGMLIFALLLIFSMGASPISCGGSSSSSGNDKSNTSDNGSNTGSGGTFTAAELVGTWTTTCRALTAGTANATYYYNVLNISSGGNWGLQQFTFSSSGCSQNPVSYWTSSGTFTVGGITSGSIQSLQFAVTTLYNQVQTGTAAQWYYGNSSNAQPLYGNVPPNFGNPTFSSAAGYDYDFFNASVTGLFASDFNSATYTTVNNVATYTTHTLTLGVGSETVPGVFSNQTTPSTPTISYSGP